jgi:hypothetical protein
MEENSELLGDDCIYPSDFEEELFDVVSVVEPLQAPQKFIMILLHVSPFERPTSTSKIMNQNLKRIKSKEESVKKKREIQTPFP